MFGVDPNMQLPVNIGAQPPQTPVPGIANMQIPNPQIKKRGGMFAGATINPGNFISGFLAGLYPQYAQSFLAPGMQRERAQLEQQQADAQSQRELQRQKDLYTFELQNPKPDTPDIVQRIDALNAITPGLGNTYAQNYARNGGGLGLVTNPATGVQYMPQSSVPAPPAEAVARLKANPAEAAQFDEIFGPGASAKVLGGPTQPASGGFPQ